MKRQPYSGMLNAETLKQETRKATLPSCHKLSAGTIIDYLVLKM